MVSYTMCAQKVKQKKTLKQCIQAMVSLSRVYINLILYVKYNKLNFIRKI